MTMSAALDLERSTVRKVIWRIVPLMALVLLFNYLDKVNIGFAAVTMNKDLGFSNTVFGAAAGFFAFGYALCGVPSTLLLHRLGARRWISVIMVAWGVISAGTAFVSTAREMLIARFILGAAEAGFTPGMIFYFSLWFPNRYRGRVLGAFLLIYPFSLVIGGPFSATLFSLDGSLGLHGWQWLFLIEALPTVVLALVVFVLLKDRPADAGWLSAAEHTWLRAELANEAQSIESAATKPARARPWRERRAWLLLAVNVGLSTSGIGAYFFMPLIIQSMGFSVKNTGLLVALPGIAATVLLPLWGIWADRAKRRETVVGAACALIMLGLLGAAPLLPSVWAIIPLSIAMVGFFGGLVAFWTLPSQYFVGAGAAIGIAIINIMGNLGTFTGPYLLGWLSDKTGTYEAGLMSLAAIAAATAILTRIASFNRARQPAVAPS
jgi:ACS family tartrate transporter-like MFS transporter